MASIYSRISLLRYCNCKTYEQCCIYIGTVCGFFGYAVGLPTSPTTPSRHPSCSSHWVYGPPSSPRCYIFKTYLGELFDFQAVVEKPIFVQAYRHHFFVTFTRMLFFGMTWTVWSHEGWHCHMVDSAVASHWQCCHIRLRHHFFNI
jgi:hypothetical protein